MMPTESLINFCKHFSEYYTKSLVVFQFDNIEGVRKYWPAEHDLKTQLSQKLHSLIALPTPEGADGFNHLREAYKVFYFDEVIGRDASGLKVAAYAMWHHIGWKKVASIELGSWIEAIALGRALAFFLTDDIISGFESPIAAARALISKGYKISAFHGQFQFEEGEIERATNDAIALFNKVGLLQSLQRTMKLMGSKEVFAYGMFMPGRKTTVLAPAEATYPYAFIYNLVLRSNYKPISSASDDYNFQNAITLCREIVSCLDLEPTHFLENAAVRPAMMDLVLQRTAHFEHLISIRQWSNHKVEQFMESFWGSAPVEKHNHYKDISEIKKYALRLWRVIMARCGSPAPFLISRNDILKCGLTNGQLERLLDVICHRKGAVNVSYNSPYAASASDLSGLAFSRPLVEYDKNRYLIPFPAAFGPALQEALLAKCFEQKHLPNAKLIGDGTEAIILNILRSKPGSTIHCGKKYSLSSPPEDGECDFIVETPKHILFIECKAKATTRSTMSGEQHEALLDYGAAILAAQIQLLRHERILKQRGKIDFTDKTSLEIQGRQVWRLSATLHEHGGLQDSSFIAALTRAFSQVSFSAESSYSKKKQVKELDNMAKGMRHELLELKKLGVELRWLELTSVSLCVSHLAVILDDYPTIDSFIESLRVVVCSGTLNPLLEHFHNRRIRTQSA